MMISNWSSPFFELLLAKPASNLEFDLLGPQLKAMIPSNLALDYILEKLPFSLFVQALSHRSFVYSLKHLRLMESNERLELLGDAILGAVVADELFQRFPQEDEGILSKRRGAMVNQEKLSHSAHILGLDQLCLVGSAEWGRSQYLSKAILCDVFEALVGAIFIHSGFEAAKTYLHKVWALEKEKTGQYPWQALTRFDPKSALQEKSMSILGQFPQYLCSEHTDDSAQGAQFLVELSVLDKVWMKGIYDSKKKGTRDLAQKALEENLIEKIERIKNQNSQTYQQETQICL